MNESRIHHELRAGKQKLRARRRDLTLPEKVAAGGRTSANRPSAASAPPRLKGVGKNLESRAGASSLKSFEAQLSFTSS
jgi:hypothetical protein